MMQNIRYEISFTQVTTPHILTGNSHRIIERLGLEGTFKHHLVPAPAMARNIFHWIQLLKVPSNLTLNTSHDEASTAFMGNLF